MQPHHTQARGEINAEASESLVNSASSKVVNTASTKMMKKYRGERSAQRCLVVPTSDR